MRPRLIAGPAARKAARHLFAVPPANTTFARLIQHPRWRLVPPELQREAECLVDEGPSSALARVEAIVREIVNDDAHRGWLWLPDAIPELALMAWDDQGLLRCWPVSAEYAAAWPTRGSA
jgi:hypothetical protein